VRLSCRRIRLGLGYAGRHLDGDLLDANRGFEGRLIGRIKPVHQGLLVLLDASDLGQRRLKGCVHSGPGV